MAKRCNSGFLLTEFNQRQSLFQFRRGCLVAVGKTLQNLVIALDRCLVIALPELNISQVEIGIAREISVRIELHVIRKFLRRQIIFSCLVVAQGIVIENIRRRSRSLLLLLLSLLRGKALLSRLHIFQLLAHFGESSLKLIQGVIQRLNLTGELLYMRATVVLLLLQGALQFRN